MSIAMENQDKVVASPGYTETAKFRFAVEQRMKRRTFIQLLPAAAIALPPSFQDIPPAESLLPLFPLDLVLLPQTNLPLHIFEERYKEMIGDCLQSGSEFGMLAAYRQSVEPIGCTASISKVLDRFPDGRMNILVRGRRRFEISMLNREKSYLRGKPEFFDDAPEDPLADALRERAIGLYRRLTNLAHLENEPFQDRAFNASDTQLSYRMMGGVPAELSWKQTLLELRSERERIRRVMDYFEKLLKEIEPSAAPRQVI
jgi:Lon protease-like protein